METSHSVFVGDSRKMVDIESGSVELVVTSPPYPMIEMWDRLFCELDNDISDALSAGDGRLAFSLMHDQLQYVWEEIDRVLVDGGIACINIGDATRTLSDSFEVYPNHSEIVTQFSELGFSVLPEILWRKPTNSASKFMGSGMVPTNAYPTLEHEYILIFRKGGGREFSPKCQDRYESAYFWEERNEWFSDVWSNVNGVNQVLEDGSRDRSAAFPLDIPYRLVNMFSVYGDTVLDPFWGTGTTTLAAMVSGRDSIGSELDQDLLSEFDSRLGGLRSISSGVVDKRINDHLSFVDDRLDESPQAFDYESSVYEFPVMTDQERMIQFYTVCSYSGSLGDYTVSYEPVGSADIDSQFGSHSGANNTLLDY